MPNTFLNLKTYYKIDNSGVLDFQLSIKKITFATETLKFNIKMDDGPAKQFEINNLLSKGTFEMH